MWEKANLMIRIRPTVTEYRQLLFVFFLDTSSQTQVDGHEGHLALVN